MIIMENINKSKESDYIAKAKRIVISEDQFKKADKILSTGAKDGGKFWNTLDKNKKTEAIQCLIHSIRRVEKKLKK